MHVLLAFLLSCFVYSTFDRQPISLTASSSSASDGVGLVMAARGKPIELVQVSEETSWIDSLIEMDSLVAEATAADSFSEPAAGDYEPASIEFFGTRAYGNRFVFLLDISYSMKARNGERFQRACDELLRSVSRLRGGQRYYVFAFCWDTVVMFRDRSNDYARVSPNHVEKLRRWVYNVNLGAGTDPRRSLALAHQMKPDAVFLLSDGHFNQPTASKTEVGWIDQRGEPFAADVQEGVQRLYTEIPIHTVAFENPFTVAAMRQIARATDGKCRYIPTRSHEPIDQARFLTTLRHIDQKHRHDQRPFAEYLTRLSHAREFIRDGELAYAEYLVRPLRNAKASMIGNPQLLTQVLTVLETELGDRRLEDFEPAPELATILDAAADDT